MQEIILPVSELKKALPGLNKIVSKKAILPVLESVQVARDAEGRLSLLATNLDSFATYHLKAARPGPVLAVLVPLAQLTRIVKGMKAEGTLDLLPVSKDKTKLRYSIAGLLVEQEVPTWPVNEFPCVPKVNGPALRLEPEFGMALRQALECCSNNPTRPLLNGACLDVTDQQFHYVVGTNGKVLFSANSFGFDLPQSVIIPDSPFLEWTGFLDEKPGLLSVEPAQAAQPANEGQPAQEVRPGYVKLQAGPWTFITEEIPGKFPDWKQAVPRPNGNWTRVDLSVEAMKQLVLVTPNLPGGDPPNCPVRLRITWNYLQVEGPNRDQADWTSISVQDVAVTGKPVTVVLNRRYLLQALRFGLHRLEIEDALHPVVFADANGAKTMVIMPVNLDDGTVRGQGPAQSSPEATPPPAEPAAPQEPPGPTTEER
jgi:DNA polymerase III sliding clamp (beta) subunit (PCNA family)